MTITTSIDFLKNNSARYLEISRFEEWRNFVRSSRNQQWLYFYWWQLPNIAAFGSTSNSSDRIRKSGLFHDTVTGKYDRRIDYLILKAIYGMPRTFVFECHNDQKASEIEATLRVQIQPSGVRHCFIGLDFRTRKDISEDILRRLGESDHYKALQPDIRKNWETFCKDVYFSMLKILNNDGSGWRTFYWGDCLEPGFLKRHTPFGYLAPAVSQVLGIKYTG